MSAATERPTVRIGIGSGVCDATTPDSDRRVEPGETFGRYVVEGRIGSGGGGIVLRARDDELGRSVAIKVIGRGSVSGESWTADAQRLAREAQILAGLSHPNIVRVFDVGIDRDHLWIAIELVEGANLSQWLQARRRSVAEIVRVFLEAARGLAAAHDAGVVHRDFKPGNVLVGDGAAEGRDVGRVRVADFGLARGPTRMAEPSRDSVPVHSASSSAALPDVEVSRTDVVMGTPGYMAPEQLAGAPPMPQTDQFAFCVSLYRALYDRLPFAVGAIPRGRPSFEPAPGRDVPTWLHHLLGRGLEIDAERRWPSMRAVIGRLERGPPRRWKIAAAVAGVATIAAAIGLPAVDDGAVACTGGPLRWQETWDDAREAEIRRALEAAGPEFAERTADRVVASLDLLADAWLVEYVRTCHDGVVQRIGARVLDARMSCLDHVRDRTRALVDVLAGADAAVAEHAADAVLELPAPGRCAAVDPTHHADDGEDPRIAELQALLDRARALEVSGRYDHALDTAAHARRVADAIGDPAHVAAANVRLGSIEAAQHDYRAAAEHLEAAAWAATSSRATDVMAEASRRLVEVLGTAGLARLEDAHTWAQRARAAVAELGSDALDQAALDLVLARLAIDAGRYADAQRTGARALALYEERLSPDDPRIATALLVQASAMQGLGDYDAAGRRQERALEIQRGSLGSGHPLVASTLAALAKTHRSAGRLPRALELADDALELARRVLPPDHPSLAAYFSERMRVRSESGDFEGARLDALEQLEILARHFGDDHPRTLGASASLAAVRAQLGELEEAEALARDLPPRLEAVLGADHPDIAIANTVLAAILARKGEVGESTDLQLRVLAMLERSLGPEHPEIAAVLNNLGVNAVRRERPEEALAYHQRALAIREASLSSDHPALAASLGNLAWALVGLERDEEARELFERALAVQRRALGDDHPALTYTLTGLGRVLSRLGETDRAIASLREALRIGERLPEQALFKDETRFFLAQVLWDRNAAGDRARARRLATLAERAARLHTPDYADAIRAWIDARPLE